VSEMHRDLITWMHLLMASLAGSGGSTLLIGNLVISSEQQKTICSARFDLVDTKRVTLFASRSSRRLGWTRLLKSRSASAPDRPVAITGMSIA